MSTHRRTENSSELVKMDTYPKIKQYLYNEQLHTISGIPFTERLVDVLACCLQNHPYGMTARILSIKSDRTVQAHVRSIRDRTSCDSREKILTFIDRSGKRHHIQLYYYHLYIKFKFEETLKSLPRSKRKILVDAGSYMENLISTDREFYESLCEHLEEANISVQTRKSGEICSHKFKVIENCSETNHDPVDDKVIHLVLNRTVDNPQKQINCYLIGHNYYLETTKVIKRIRNNATIDRLLNEFISEYRSVEAKFGATKLCIYKENRFELKTVIPRVKNKFRQHLLSVILSISLAVTLYIIIPSSPINPGIWNPPPDLQHLIEREKLEDDVWKMLESRDQEKLSIIGLCGLGGVGKTTLAKSLVKSPKNNYSFIGWINSDSEESLIHDFNKLGKEKKLFTPDLDQEEKVARVKHFLDKQDRILLVFDNVTDMDCFNKYLPRKGHIIVTSRDNNIPGRILVGVMSESESYQLFGKLLSQENADFENKQMKELAKKLDYFPLAISQAGSYISENKISLNDYIELYSTDRNKLLNTNVMPAMDQHEGAYITWDLIYKKIQSAPENADAIKLLHAISAFQTTEVPKRLLSQYMYDSTSSGSMINLNKELRKLCKYSFIQVDSNSVSILNIVRDWIKSKHSPEKEHNITLRAIESIKKIYPWESKAPQGTPLQNMLKLHAEALFNEISTKQNKEDFFELYTVLGACYYSSGEYIKSREYFGEALLLCRKKNSANHYDHIEILNYLGLVNNKLGNYEESEKILIEALYKVEKYFGADHINAADTLYIIGQNYLYRGKFVEAEKNILKSLSIVEQKFGSDFVGHLRKLFYLSRARLYQGYYSDAKTYIERAKEITDSENVYDENHIEVAHTLHNLGKILLYEGNYTKAKETLEKALKTRKKYYHDEHLEVAYTSHHLGLAYHKLNDSRALATLQSALAVLAKNYKKYHIETAYTTHAIGEAYRSRGNFNKAEEMLLDAIQIKKHFYGEKNIFTLNSLSSLAALYIQTGRRDKGVELFKRVRDLLIDIYGEDNIFSVKSTANLGNAYRIIGEYDKSEVLLKQSLSLIQDLNSTSNVAFGEIKTSLAILYDVTAKPELKKKMLDEAQEIFQSNLPLSHPSFNELRPLRRGGFIKTNLGVLVTLAP